MTTLSDFLATNPTLAEAQGHYFLFTEAERNSMLAKQDTLTTNNKIAPTLTTDGRYGSCCDLMTAIGEGQIYNSLYVLLDHGALDDSEVVDKATLLAMLPTEEI